MSHLTLEQANALVAGVFSKGRALGLKPLTAAVLDPGGHLLALQRQDGASTLRPQIAIAKAAGALDLGVSSRKIGEMAAERPSFVGALAAMASNGLLPAAGGVILIDGQGDVLGAVGVTGDTSDNDEACALTAAAQAGIAVKP